MCQYVLVYVCTYEHTYVYLCVYMCMVIHNTHVFVDGQPTDDLLGLPLPLIITSTCFDFDRNLIPN